MSRKHYVQRADVVYSFHHVHRSVSEIEPGDEVTLETYDARTGTILCDEDLLERPHPVGANPATGPITVRGAEPGDSLCVEIRRIELADRGFLAVKAGEGLLAHRAQHYATRIVEVRDDMVFFDEHISFPTQPMVGVIGTAPQMGGVSTSLAGPHGGNMDNKYIAEGSKVHLPVYHRGAFLAIGDVHASMGDGEITFIGLEISARVTVVVELNKAAGLRRPMVETEDAWVTTGEHIDLAEAARMAAEQMVEFMQETAGMTFEQAYMLMSAVVDVQICQCCEPGEFPVTTRAVIPKKVLR